MFCFYSTRRYDGRFFIVTKPQKSLLTIPYTALHSDDQCRNKDFEMGGIHPQNNIHNENFFSSGKKRFSL